MLQAKVADAYNLTQIVVLISGRIQEPISKDVPTSPFFLVTKRNRRNIVSSFIPQSCNLFDRSVFLSRLLSFVGGVDQRSLGVGA